MSKKHSPWSYVVLNDDKAVGAFPSAALAFFVWKAFVDFNERTFDIDNRPFVSCNRFRAKYDPFGIEPQDLTLSFMRVWEMQKNKEI